MTMSKIASAFRFWSFRGDTPATHHAVISCKLHLLRFVVDYLYNNPQQCQQLEQVDYELT